MNNKTNFWQDLPRPFFCLAPMADVTDPAFRRIIAKYGKPDVTWTEFVAVDGLLSEHGRVTLERDLEYTDSERPIVAQIFGSKPENFEKIAGRVADMGFDGIDINMGCPDRKVEKQGAGCNLIKNPERAQEIIRATMRGSKGLPVSVKTRIGYNQDEVTTWIPKILETKPAALTIHARTRKEMSKVPPHWDAFVEVVKLRDQISPKTLVIANGDILSKEQGRELLQKTGGDGVMMGRAIFGNPWLFANTTCAKHNCSIAHPPRLESKRATADCTCITTKDKLLVMLEHTKLFLEILGDIKNFALMKKHYKAYVNDFPGAKELRIALMAAETYDEIEQLTQEFIDKNDIN